ncbi:MAG: zf-HC2 domain-containing protein [Planctomycetota bacterium]
MHRRVDCEAVRPLLVATLENEVTAEERELVLAHLSTCTACCSAAISEKALTSLMGGVRRTAAPRLHARWLTALAAVLLIGITVALVSVLLGPSAAQGSMAWRSISIDPSMIYPSLIVQDDRVLPLQDNNHLDIPVYSESVVQIPGTGEVTIVGPAALDLDRTQEGWKLALMRGEVRVRVENAARLLVTSVLGQRWLTAGNEVVSITPACFALAQSQSDQTTPAEILDLGHRAFFQLQDMAAAERHYRAALAHPDLTSDQKSQALFYLGASLGRQDKFKEAIEIGNQWLELCPQDDARHYVLLFQGIYQQRLGNTNEARRCWQVILDEAPQSELAEHARRHLNLMAPPAATGSTGAPVEVQSGRLEARAEAAPGGYLVVAVGLRAEDREHQEFMGVARDVAAFHHTRVVPFDGQDFAALERLLRESFPRDVLFVIPPELLDINWHRHIVLLSAVLDSDIFPDFTFGYFTAKSGASLRALWERTLATHENGLPSKRWMSAFVTGGTKSSVYPRHIPELAREAGFEGSGYGFAVIESDPDCLSFVEKTLPLLQEAAVISLTGNGDPQGIWLFEGARNLDASKHWKFDRALVGSNPNGEMPRITAEKFAALTVGRPVVWSGTCHSAATCRVFVEGDIVSTFGKTEETTVYELAPQESLGLAIIEAGAVAFLAPIAANHGYSTDLEIEFALHNGASLGETIKSTYDDVFLAAKGALRLDFQVAGEPQRNSEPVMQGGGANRLLIGDPALKPFEPARHPSESVEIQNARKEGFDIVVRWQKGFHPKAWDMYGTERARDWRIGARISLDDLELGEGSLRFTTAVQATDEQGQALPYRLTHAVYEEFHGRRFLHLQANAERRQVQDRAARAVFSITLEREQAPEDEEGGASREGG